MVAHGAGAAGALALMVLGYWVVHRLTPEALNTLLLGTVFFLLVALRALMALRALRAWLPISPPPPT